MGILETYLSLDTSIIVGYLVLTLILGLNKLRHITSLREYALGSKHFSVPILTATITATVIGGAATMGLAAKCYSTGLVFVFIFLGSVIGNLIVARYFATRFDDYTNMFTVGDIMDTFYGKWGKILTGFGGAMVSLGFVAAQISAMAYLFQHFLHIPFEYVALVGMGVTIFYSTIGGVRGVVLTDVLQFAVLIIAIPMALNISISSFPSFEALFSRIPVERFHPFPPGEPAMYYIIMFLVFSIPALSPAMVQRLLMARSAREASIAIKASAYIALPMFFIAGFIGIVAYAVNPNLQADLAMPFLINETLPAGFKGLAVVGMLAVIMSSADSYLNAAAICFVHDVIKPLYRRPITERNEVLLDKIMTVILGITTLVIALRFSDIVTLMILFYAFWVPVVLIPLMAGILGWRSSKKTFICSAMAGLLTFAIWNIFSLKGIFKIDHMLPCIIANFGVFSIGSILEKRREAAGLPPLNMSGMRLSALGTCALAWLQRHLKSHAQEPPYVTFGIFCALNFNIPFFMWSLHQNDTITLTMRLVAGILCFLLIIKDYWPKAAEKYLQLYWYGTVIFCLPFFTVFMTLQNHGSLEWLMNISLMLMFLVVICSWFYFTLVLVVGVASAWLVYTLFYGEPTLMVNPTEAYIAGYMYLFSILIGLIFARRREVMAREKFHQLQMLAGAIAHEMRTPLHTIGSYGRGLKKYLPVLLDNYDGAVRENPNLASIPDTHRELLSTVPSSLSTTVDQTQNVIDMLLMKVQELPLSKQWPACSMKACITETMTEYPFTDRERNMMDVDTDFEDFTFLGDTELMKHVFFNLIKNALHHVKASGKTDGKVKIFVERGYTKNRVHVYDTGQGIPRHQLAQIFTRFAIKRKGGTGVGLAFCRDVLQSFGGNITCKSEHNLYADFVLAFPRIYEDEGKQ